MAAMAIVWLELGLAGFVIYAVVRETAARLARLISSNGLGLLVKSYIALYAMTEGVLLVHSDLSWLLFMALLLQAAPVLAPARMAVA